MVRKNWADLKKSRRCKSSLAIWMCEAELLICKVLGFALG